MMTDSELLMRIRWWQENPTMRLNPYLKVPFGGAQSPEFHAWQEGAKSAIKSLGEILESGES